MKSIAALRAFVLGALSALALPAAAAEQIVLKVHHFLPATSNAQVQMIQPWCDKVNRESGDRIKCQIYPAMQLGGTPQQLFDQLRDGVVDMIWTVPTYAAGRFSKAEVFELPFIVTSAKAGSQALWQYVQKNAMDEFKGVRPILLHVHDGSVLHLTSKQVKTLEDLRGLKIRAATRINARMLAALGATPVQMPLPQVAEALSKGVIDGAMVPWEGMPALKLHEIAKHHVEPPAGTPRFSNAIFLFGMNPAKYDSLPPDLRKIIDANSGAAMSAWAGERWDATVEPHRKLARDRGNQFYTLPEAENARWVKATENVDDDWVKEVEKKGAEGKRLVGEARQLVGQFSR